MAVAFVAAGDPVQFDGNAVDLSPAVGYVDGEILVALILSDAASGATATGWTSLGHFDGDLLQRVDVLWKRADAPADDVTNFDTGDGTAVFGVILSFSGALASGDAIGVTGTSDGAVASATVSAPTITPPSDANGVLWIGAATRALAAPTCSGYSGTGPTFTECFDGGSESVGLGLFMSIHAAFGVQATAGATGARTATLSAAPAENQGMMLSIKPAVPVSDAAPGGHPSRADSVVGFNPYWPLG